MEKLRSSKSIKYKFLKTLKELKTKITVYIKWVGPRQNTSINNKMGKKYTLPNIPLAIMLLSLYEMLFIEYYIEHPICLLSLLL